MTSRSDPPGESTPPGRYSLEIDDPDDTGVHLVGKPITSLTRDERARKRRYERRLEADAAIMRAIKRWGWRMFVFVAGVAGTAMVKMIFEWMAAR